MMYEEEKEAFKGIIKKAMTKALDPSSSDPEIGRNLVRQMVYYSDPKEQLEALKELRDLMIKINAPDDKIKVLDKVIKEDSFTVREMIVDILGELEKEPKFNFDFTDWKEKEENHKEVAELLFDVMRVFNILSKGDNINGESTSEPTESPSPIEMYNSLSEEKRAEFLSVMKGEGETNEPAEEEYSDMYKKTYGRNGNETMEEVFERLLEKASKKEVNEKRLEWAIQLSDAGRYELSDDGFLSWQEYKAFSKYLVIGHVLCENRNSKDEEAMKDFLYKKYDDDIGAMAKDIQNKIKEFNRERKSELHTVLTENKEPPAPKTLEVRTDYRIKTDIGVDKRRIV